MLPAQKISRNNFLRYRYITPTVSTLKRSWWLGDRKSNRPVKTCLWATFGDPI